MRGSGHGLSGTQVADQKQDHVASMALPGSGCLHSPRRTSCGSDRTKPLHGTCGNLQLISFAWDGKWSRLSILVHASYEESVLELINLDEIFHIPQAQQYCKGLFTSWDPMITTPPGLYFLSLLYTTILFPTMKVMGTVSSLVDMCSPLVLRSLNVALAVVCAILFQNISIHLEPNISTKQTFLKALCLTWYPLHWFFMFLFYTDVGSTTAVMAMYLACLKGAYWTSGVLGLVAILFRQTNAVWTVFVACVGMIDFLYKNSQTHQNFFQNLSGSDQSGQSKTSVSMDPEDTKNGMRTPGFIEGILSEALFILHQAWDQWVELLWNFFPFMLSTSCFLAFVGYNGSIVLGAKDAHKASLHLVQVLYFAAASVLALVPMHLDLCLIKENFEAVNPFRRGVTSYITAGLIGSMACVHFFSLAHPYLISDNRHYTFYIWRKIINPHWSAKYLLSIVYLYSWISILAVIGKRARKVWLVLFCLALIAVLAPAPLIEFRYYTIPFYFIALHTPTNAGKGYLAWLLICIQYSIVNLLTMYMFLFRPFFNPSSRESERFIW